MGLVVHRAGGGERTVTVEGDSGGLGGIGGGGRRGGGGSGRGRRMSQRMRAIRPSTIRPTGVRKITITASIGVLLTRDRASRLRTDRPKMLNARSMSGPPRGFI